MKLPIYVNINRMICVDCFRDGTKGAIILSIGVRIELSL